MLLYSVTKIFKQKIYFDFTPLDDEEHAVASTNSWLVKISSSQTKQTKKRLKVKQ